MSCMFVQGPLSFPFLKGLTLKIIKHQEHLDPLRIAAVPGVVLDVIVKAQTPRIDSVLQYESMDRTSSSEELSLTSLPKAISNVLIEGNTETPYPDLDTAKTINRNPESLNTPINSTTRRNPAYGLQEAAIENYSHIDKPAPAYTVTPIPAYFDLQKSEQYIPGPQELIDNTPLTSPTRSNKSNQSNLRSPQIVSPKAISKDYTQTVIDATLGDADAQVALGDMYLNGHGVQRDYQKAMDWFLKAANGGDAVGQRKVGVLYGSGWGVEQNYQTSMEWYLKAAAQGNAQAECNIGIYYRYGYGVERDPFKAMEYFKKSADQNNANAKIHIGDIYYNAEGVPRDYNKAMARYQEAASQGSEMAKFNIGVMFEYGHGCVADTSIAMKWYQEAADQGSVEAKNRLEILKKGLAAEGRVGSGKKRKLINKLFN
ncbi:hypothetical protein FBU30_004815 [Linnemannia zychae]|nr:hypothetical protein FBU30_004815 [Linnemannia zychae]